MYALILVCYSPKKKSPGVLQNISAGRFPEIIHYRRIILP